MPDARGEPESQELHNAENMVGEPCGVGVPGVREAMEPLVHLGVSHRGKMLPGAPLSVFQNSFAAVPAVSGRDDDEPVGRCC